MYKDYLTAIQQRINDRLPEVKHVAFYNEEYQHFDEARPPKLPAVYVEFDNPVSWQTAGNGLQVAPDTSIRLHLVMFDLDDHPDKLFTLAQKLHQAMHGFEIYDAGGQKLSTAWMRIGSGTEKYDQIKTAILTYSMALYDTSTLPDETEVSVQLNVEHH